MVKLWKPSARIARTAGRTAVVVALVAVAFGLGRLSAPDAGTAPASAPAGRPASSSAAGGDGYAAGVQAGEALGVAEGRALQVGAALPPEARDPARQAFTAGYTAGTGDVFSGYDGGWRRGVLYVITLVPGDPPLPYRIAARTELHAGTTYTLCGPGPQICEHPTPHAPPP